MITIKQKDNSQKNTGKQVLYPRYSRAQAYRLWKQGIMTENCYLFNYMNSEERAEYYRQKRLEEIEKQKAKQKEIADQKKQEKADLEKLEKDVYTAIDKGLSKFFDNKH